MARQAILERCGWRFIRLRGTRFFREPDETTEWICGELERLGVTPGAGTTPHSEVLDAKARAFRDEVLRRAWEVMREQGWLEGIDPGQVADDAQPGIEEGEGRA
jgi:transposase